MNAAVIFSICIPLAAAFLVTASEWLTSPSHAEHHSRKRSVSATWHRTEVLAGCAFGLLIAAALIAALVFLWSSKPAW